MRGTLVTALVTLWASAPISSANPVALKVEHLIERGGGSLPPPPPPPPKCSKDNAAVRREWRTLSSDQRKNYTAAVLCLQAASPRSSATDVPGARSRFDDFVAVHINQTLIIHYTATFLPWHRYMVWLYEKALREECGYQGYQPYWNWALDAQDPTKSPIFDGSPTSMSGNGATISHPGITLSLPPYPDIHLPPGTGGGCVTTGPFANMSVNLGPAALPNTPFNPNNLAYNPRCLKRDLNPYVSATFTNASAVAALLQTSPDIATFQLTMQGVPGSGNIGVHGGGHYTIGGDPGGDVFTSPGDPVFYLHHGMIDRLWATWQAADPKNRQDAIAGTGTFLNSPPSPNVTLDDYVDVGVNGGPVQIRSLMSTMAGPFCYVYA